MIVLALARLNSKTFRELRHHVDNYDCLNFLGGYEQVKLLMGN